MRNPQVFETDEQAKDDFLRVFQSDDQYEIHRCIVSSAMMGLDWRWIYDQARQLLLRPEVAVVEGALEALGFVAVFDKASDIDLVQKSVCRFLYHPNFDIQCRAECSMGDIEDSRNARRAKQR